MDGWVTIGRLMPPLWLAWLLSMVFVWAACGQTLVALAQAVLAGPFVALAAFVLLNLLLTGSHCFGVHMTHKAFRAPSQSSVLHQTFACAASLAGVVLIAALMNVGSGAAHYRGV